MTVWDQNVLLVVSDPALKRELFGELLLHRPGNGSGTPRGHYQVSSSANIEDALARPVPEGAVAVLDQSALASEEITHARWKQARALAEAAPVILIVDSESVGSLNGLAALIAQGRIEMVFREGASIALVMALIARHSLARHAVVTQWDSRGPNFGEALRHELNNPLTGILGNAELLLARRDKLPSGAAERLKTIADLAVHLRETVRRLSNAWEEHAARTREVEVGD